ncbi:MAG: UMP kinase [Victivallaceae bacterium]|nr:UMP kinase [Victivallaceae bacterium]
MYKYKRVLIKVSGEALKGSSSSGYDADSIRLLVEKIRTVVDNGIELVLVFGAGNIWRGITGASNGMDRVSADYMGMLATVMNALCVRDALENSGISALVQTSIPMEPVAARYNRFEAEKALESGTVVIFAGGTGSPFFTTDTTAALRALETHCQAVLKATKVDGIYTADPFKDPNAVRFSTITYEEALSRRLKVMDSTAFSMCSDHDLPIIVFNFSEPESLNRVLSGDTTIGTIVCRETSH